MTLETSFAQSPYGDQCTSRYGKMGNQRRASCFATLMQNESNCDVAHFTTYESNLSCNKSGSQVARVQTPPTPQKKSGRVTSMNLLRKSCSGIHLHKLFFFSFPSDNWKGVERLTRLWTLVQHVRSYYFFWGEGASVHRLLGWTWIESWESWANFFKFWCYACKNHQKRSCLVLSDEICFIFS